MVEIVKIEEILTKVPKILWHHGTCDLCRRRLTLVLHLGYNTQPKCDYRLCLQCLRENAQLITYGWMDFKVDKNIEGLE